MAYIVATSGCATTSRLPAKPSLEELRTTSAAARTPLDRYDPLVYCASTGAFRCPEVTPKTIDDTPPPAVIAQPDPNQLLRDQAARMAAGSSGAGISASTGPSAPERVIRFDASMFLFDFDKAVLRPKAQDVLRAAAPDLKGRRLTIAGFTDAVGSEAYNTRLSQRRAEAVRNFLVAEGHPADLISLKGEGRCCFVAQNDTEEGRQQNRRVEIRVDAVVAPEGAMGAAVTSLQSTK